MNAHLKFGAVVLTTVATAGMAVGQINHNCAPMADTEFKMTTLVSRNAQNELEEPLKMAIDMSDQGQIDIYIAQRKGKLRKFNVASATMTTIGTLPVEARFEDGFSGIVLDPGFKTNRWMYLYYGHGKEGDFRFRLSRFKLDAQGNLDMASERPILNIPAGAAKFHTGGAMQFDKAGNLFITVGDNHAQELGPGSTNDLRGKILRIKPIAFPDAQTPVAGEGTTYTIPAGNLKDTWNTTQDKSKIKPEIYVMGTRNAYTLALDHKTGRIAWGDIGPDLGKQTEEHNVAAASGNYGYPFYAGAQIPVITNTGTPDKPINAHAQNTGLRELPPAITATNPYQQQAAVTGPIFRYNDAPKGSTVKLPPHFDGLWFVTDYSSGYIDTVRLDAAGTKLVHKARAWKNWRFQGALDFQQGPDGALYTINYAGNFSSTASTGIVRIEYSGPCRPEPVVSIAELKSLGHSMLKARGLAIEVKDVGRHVLQVTDLHGREVASFRGAGAARYDLASALSGRSGLYTARLSNGTASVSQTLMLGN